ncbi:carboxypeptidase-like regulatory domain-containing protein [Mesonia ostreae]|uniref:Carboxypeptidase-like regulatory domain-containing protein n=1 Tax=Mesonia ostreae TaxID=861110 RepID=A0ABU2KET6_9FLAO|nr:carboxypeptidase-like regulatory domain-containing protein [Mesonia ostreae]MDT0293217.1 carboxypeptidase-like regulatory domain-containing protein [Mesonia ostreae]
MKSHIPVLIAFLLFSGAIYAQKRVFSGKIIADSISIREVNVVNLNSKKGTINNANGRFQISAKAGDTLFFSSLQYEPYQITVAAEDFTGEKRIYLLPLVNELEEVNISDLYLTGLLDKDVETIETQPYLNAASFGLPVVKNRSTLAERRIYTATITGGGIIPIDPIINYFSGRLAMVYRQLDYENEKAAMEKAYYIFPIDFYTEELKIPEALIEDFIYYCIGFKPFKDLIVKEKPTLALIKFLKETAMSYHKFKEINIETP